MKRSHIFLWKFVNIILAIFGTQISEKNLPANWPLKQLKTGFEAARLVKYSADSTLEMKAKARKWFWNLKASSILSWLYIIYFRWRHIFKTDLEAVGMPQQEIACFLMSLKSMRIKYEFVQYIKNIKNYIFWYCDDFPMMYNKGS